MIDPNGYLSDSTLIQVLAASKDATAIYDSPDLRIRFVNGAMLRIWGKEVSVSGKTFEEAIPEIAGQPFTALLKNIWATAQPFTATDSPADLLINGKLTTSYFDFEYQPLLNVNGDTYCILHTATDVTERLKARQLAKEKEALARQLNKELAAANEELASLNEEYRSTNEEGIEDSEQRFRSLAEGSEVMISVNDINGNVEYVNQAWLNLTGRTQQQMRAYGWGDFLHPDDQESLLKKFVEGINSKAAFTLEFRMMDKDNKPRWIYTKVNPQLGPEGDYTGTISSSIDITERKLYQEELEEVNSRLKIALDAGSFGSTEVDLASGKMICNEQFKKLFGRAPDEEMVYADIFAAMQPEQRDEIRRKSVYARQNHTIYEAEYQVTWPDGSLHWISAHGRARYNEQGQPVKMIGILSDITESKRDEQRKNDFIGMVSHELKTPLTSLTALIQLARLKLKDNPDSFWGSCMEKADTQVKRMGSMINGFLNVSRLESGKLLIVKESFDLDELIKDVVKESELTVSTHTIHNNICDSLHVDADHDKIGSVITNLLSNAVKYSPKGKNIYVTCEIAGRMAKVSIKDEGIGIQTADKDKLFDRYYRVENINTKNISGFGIGLYLSAEIINRHDGQIGVESESGHGSTFWFTIPLD